MSNSVSVTLSSNDIYSLIKSLSASDHYHHNLLKSSEISLEDFQYVLDINSRIKSILNSTLCPCPPETSDTALSSTDDVDGGILARHALLSETVVGTSEIPLPDCPICHEPVDIDQFNHNGGACNFCYHELSNDSYLNAIDLERRLL